MSDDKKKELQKRLDAAAQRAAKRTRSVQYQNDTIKVNYRNYDTEAYFEPSTGRLVNNIKGEQSEETTRLVMAHEAKHASNAKIGIPDVSAEQFYKLRVLDEVSAHLTMTLAWRDKYLKSDNKQALLDETYDGIPAEYKDAIAEGKINPESKNPKQFDKEMELLAKTHFNGLAKYDRYFNTYEDNFKAHTRSYMNTTGRDFKENDAEYERFAKHYMTISGIDFRQYLDKNYESEIYIPPSIHNAGKNMAENQDADAAQVMAGNTLVYDGKISLEQYHLLLQHQKIANNIKYNINDSEKEALAAGSHDYDEKIGVHHDTFKHITTYDGLRGNDMDKHLKNGMDLALNRASGNEPANDAEFERRLKEIYTLEGTNVDLREHIKEFDVNDVPYAESEAIREFRKNPEKYKAEHPYERAYAYDFELHGGEPEWAVATADQRVSEVKTMDVFDTEGDCLSAEREQRVLAEEMERLKKEEELKKVEPLRTEKPKVYAPIGDKRMMEMPNPKFDKAEIRTTVNEATGEISQVALLDGKKHGAEIMFDKDGKVTGYTFYDHGKELSPEGVQLDIRKEDGMTYVQTTKDGKPFGAKILSDAQGKTKAAFYEQNGIMIEGSEKAKIEKTEVHTASDKSVLMAQMKTDKLRQAAITDILESQMSPYAAEMQNKTAQTIPDLANVLKNDGYKAKSVMLQNRSMQHISEKSEKANSETRSFYTPIWQIGRGAER